MEAGRKSDSCTQIFSFRGDKNIKMLWRFIRGPIDYAPKKRVRTAQIETLIRKFMAKGEYLSLDLVSLFFHVSLQH